MQRFEVGDYVFIVSEHYPEGNVNIQFPLGVQSQTTMDGRVSVSVPIETLLNFVGEHYVKPALVARIAKMEPIEVLLGSM